MNELDKLREWGSWIEPSTSQKKHAKAALSAEISKQSRRRPTTRWQRLRRPIVLAGGVLVLGAATAVAAIYQFSPEPALETEGRGLVQGSLELERSVNSADVTWTAYSYLTDDDLLCFDFHAALTSTTEPLGSIGSCTSHQSSVALSGVIGGLSVEDSYRQILAGTAPTEAETVRATTDDGGPLTDTVINGVWLIAPEEAQDRWVVEMLNEVGETVGTLVLVDGELG